MDGAMDDAMVAQSMTQLMTHRRQNSAWTQCEPLTSCNGSSMKYLTPPPPTKTTSKPERQASHQPCPLQSTSETVVPGATPFDRRLVVQGCSAAGNERQRMEARLRTARNVQHVSIEGERVPAEVRELDHHSQRVRALEGTPHVPARPVPPTQQPPHNQPTTQLRPYRPSR